MRIEVFKGEMAWAIDKRLQFTVSYYTIPLHYPTRDLQRSYSYKFQLSKLFQLSEHF